MKTAINELIEEFENIKITKCKSLQEMVFFDGVLSIIGAKYIEKERNQIIEAYFDGTAQFDNAAKIENPKTAIEYYNEKYNS